MSKVVINESSLTAIGNAIREKNGSTVQYKPSEMADAISAIESGGASNILTPRYVLKNRCANGGDYVSGNDLDTWTWDVNGYTTYGFALNDVTKLKITGAFLNNSFTKYTVRENILFVSGFTNDGGGTGVIDSVNIVTVPETYSWESPPSEYIITVPQELDIDGIYLSCGNGGTPVLEVVETLMYAERYKDGFEAGVDALLLNNVSVIDSNITGIRDYACYSQTSIISVNLPNVTRMGTQVFRACTQLTKINAPKVTYLGSYCFYTCSRLAKVDFPVLDKIDTYCFAYCSALTAVIMRSSTVVTLVNSNAFNNSAVAKGTGFIYVPASLVDSYKSASNWSTYANQIRAIEDYPDICG